MEKTEISNYEYKILNYIKDKKNVNENNININENERIISSSISYLEFKKLIDVRKEYKKTYSITDEGDEYLKNGFPEEKLYNILKDKKELTVREIQNYLNDKYKIAMANLAKLGIKPVNGKIVYNNDNLNNIFSENRLVLSGIKDKKYSENKKINEFIKRNLITEKNNLTRIININDSGLNALKNYENNDYMELLTPEIIASGEWKNKKFRKYDLNSRVERINGAGLHPLTYLIEEIRKIFLEMGFTEMHGHYMEYTAWNMDMLFIPQDHPARDLQDTFYLKNNNEMEFEDPEILKIVKRVHEKGYKNYSGWNYKWSEEEAKKIILRTHTTVNTIRHLYHNKEEPQFVFSIEKVFRHESVDWKHLSELYQIEGSVYSKDANLSTLKWLLREFYSRLGFDNIRFLPSYYPYTEPSMDVIVDINGKEVEMGGSGIFRPEVTGPLGLKSPVLAFGLGLERLAMIYYNLNDIREIYNGDLNWLKNYKIRF